MRSANLGSDDRGVARLLNGVRGPRWAVRNPTREIIGAATPVCTPLTPVPVRPSSSSTATACAQQTAMPLAADTPVSSVTSAAAAASVSQPGGMPAWGWAAITATFAVLAAGAVLFFRRNSGGIPTIRNSSPTGRRRSSPRLPSSRRSSCRCRDHHRSGRDATSCTWTTSSRRAAIRCMSPAKAAGSGSSARRVVVAWPTVTSQSSNSARNTGSARPTKVISYMCDLTKSPLGLLVRVRPASSAGRGWSSSFPG